VTARDRARLLRPQSVPLWLGIAPLLMTGLYALRSGTGLNWIVAGLMALGLAGFFVSFSYHRFCLRGIPRVVIKPMPVWRGAIVVAAILPFTLLNLKAASLGPALWLSPNTMMSPTPWVQLAAELVLKYKLTPTEFIPPEVSPFITGGPFLGGALWGALGYGLVFALAGLGFAALRKEAFDPRQEAFGGTSSWPAMRSLIGYYYGLSLGFWFGVGTIGLSQLFFGSTADSPSLKALLSALGAVADPNLAFTNAFSVGGLLLAFMTLFLGRADFTAPFSDPRPEEKEPDMKIKIPELPVTPEPEFDFASIGHETEQIAQTFQQQLGDLARQLGFNEPIEAAISVATAPSEDVAEETEHEPPVTNVISARRPDFDVSFDSAMGQLSNVYVQLSAQLGSTELPLTEWLTMAEGSILELPRPKDNTVTVCINGKPIGKGRAVMLEDHKAIKVLQLNADAAQSYGR
jgi:flagellar motor switch/type III secretory pathway protein FliN